MKASKVNIDALLATYKAGSNAKLEPRKQSTFTFAKTITTPIPAPNLLGHELKPISTALPMKASKQFVRNPFLGQPLQTKSLPKLTNQRKNSVSSMGSTQSQRITSTQSQRRTSFTRPIPTPTKPPAKSVVEPVSKTVKRWYNLKMTGDQLQTYTLQQQPKFQKFKYNVFILNKAALTIQHWFFKSKQHRKRIEYVAYGPPAKQETQPAIVNRVLNKTTLAQKPPLVKKGLSKTLTQPMPTPKRKEPIENSSMTTDHASRNQTFDFNTTFSQTVQTPNQIIVVQSNNGTYDSKQLQEFVLSAMSKHQSPPKAVSKSFDKPAIAPKSPRTARKPIQNHSIDNPEWIPLFKKSEPRRLKEYTPSVAAPKSKSRDDFSINRKKKKKLKNSKSVKSIQSVQSVKSEAMPTNNQILQALSQSFNIITDKNGNIVFQQKLQQQQVPSPPKLKSPKKDSPKKQMSSKNSKNITPSKSREKSPTKLKPQDATPQKSIEVKALNSDLLVDEPTPQPTQYKPKQPTTRLKPYTFKPLPKPKASAKPTQTFAEIEQRFLQATLQIESQFESNQESQLSQVSNVSAKPVFKPQPLKPIKPLAPPKPQQAPKPWKQPAQPAQTSLQKPQIATTVECIDDEGPEDNNSKIKRLNKLKTEIKEIEDELRSHDADKQLDKQTIKEVQSYKSVANYPQLMQALCILFDPTWTVNQTRQQALINCKVIISQLPKKLQAFEPMSLNQEQLTLIGSLQFERKSQAMTQLGSWIMQEVDKRRDLGQSIRKQLFDRAPSELERRVREVNELELELFGGEEHLDVANLNILSSLQPIDEVDFDVPELSDNSQNETLNLRSLDIEVDCTKGRTKGGQHSSTTAMLQLMQNHGEN